MKTLVFKKKKKKDRTGHIKHKTKHIKYKLLGKLSNKNITQNFYKASSSHMKENTSANQQSYISENSTS